MQGVPFPPSGHPGPPSAGLFLLTGLREPSRTPCQIGQTVASRICYTGDIERRARSMNECEIRLLNSDGTYASIAAQFQTSDVLAFGPDIDWRTSSVLKSGERDSRY